MIIRGSIGIVSQMRRAAVSIGANIAEGAARQSRKEFMYFFTAVPLTRFRHIREACAGLRAGTEQRLSGIQ